jgi:cytidyltransferase-like protein
MALLRILFSRKLYRKHNWTYWSLLAVLMLRAASTSLSRDVLSNHTINERDVIFDGLFMSIITSDLIVAKMAGRDLHSLVVIMASGVVLPHTDFLIIAFIVFYFLAVFSDLMNHMNLPLLQRCSNVYCDGIYDLCHVGHKNLFRRALSHGNRLFVGVVGDEDANSYKRPPIMSAAERESEVRSCKCVTKVISNAPCFGLTEDFIRRHRIHVVAFGVEYQERYPNPDDDPYYKVPRKMGIATPMPRTQDISTSDLISRIQARGTDEKKPLPPSKRQKTGNLDDAMGVAS